jgi:hypothetical protein
VNPQRYSRAKTPLRPKWATYRRLKSWLAWRGPLEYGREIFVRFDGW